MRSLVCDTIRLALNKIPKFPQTLCVDLFEISFSSYPFAIVKFSSMFSSTVAELDATDDATDDNDDNEAPLDDGFQSDPESENGSDSDDSISIFIQNIFMKRYR